MGVPTVPQKRWRGRPRTAPWGRKSALGVKELQLHATQKVDGRFKSGRLGGYVYYTFHGRQCWRRYVVPKDPRTLPQLRSRAAFGAASKAWSQSLRLTNEVRAVWHAAAEKVQSRPSLGQSGPLTSQLLFVGLNCAKEQTGREMLWELPQPIPQSTGTRRQQAESASQARQLESVKRSVSGPPRCCGANTTRQHRNSPRYAAKSQDAILSSQVARPQRVARPTWERPHTSTGVPPEQCRWTAGCSRGIGAVVPRQSWASLAQAPRNRHWRELWRGG
jgi:hypothetical protein